MKNTTKYFEFTEITRANVISEINKAISLLTWEQRTDKQMKVFISGDVAAKLCDANNVATNPMEFKDTLKDDLLTDNFFGHSVYVSLPHQSDAIKIVDGEDNILVEQITYVRPSLLDHIKSHLKSIPVTERLHPDFKIVLSSDTWDNLVDEKPDSLISCDMKFTEGILKTTGVLVFGDNKSGAYNFIVDPIQTKHFDFYNPVKAGALNSQSRIVNVGGIKLPVKTK